MLVPVALFSNWQVPRRRGLVTDAALVYFAMRTWTYVYFAPVVIGWGQTAPGVPFSPQLLAEIQQWLDLSRIRGILDIALALCLVLATLVPLTSAAIRTPTARVIVP